MARSEVKMHDIIGPFSTYQTDNGWFIQYTEPPGGFVNNLGSVTEHLYLFASRGDTMNVIYSLMAGDLAMTPKQKPSDTFLLEGAL
jgi:hypothetical protein